jgi:hypothetical protein
MTTVSIMMCSQLYRGHGAACRFNEHREQRFRLLLGPSKPERLICLLTFSGVSNIEQFGA